ncbi:MAG: FG-GAP repeat domain-containing protein [bacterium]
MKKRNQSFKRWISAKPGWATDRTRHYRRNLFALLVFGVFLLGCMNSFSQEELRPATAEFTFEQFEVVTDSTERQTVLTGFLIGGAMAELAVLNIDENDGRRLSIYVFADSTWVPTLDATLRPEVLFVDVANIGGHDRLVTYEPGRLNWFDPESATERALVAVTSNFNPPRRGEIPHVDVTRDVNGDDRDDLVVPDTDGFWVFIQMSDGAFADPVKIGPATDMSRIYGADGYRYNPWGQSRVYGMDYNRDGRSDLVFWNEDHFEVHLQDERGLFDPAAQTFTTEVAFDSDKLDTLTTGNMAGKVLHSLTDMNGDDVADLVVFSLQGESISKKRSAYEVHFGAAVDGCTVFSPDIGLVFKSDERIQLGMDRQDFDGDGHVDLMFTTIEVEYLEWSLWKCIKGFFGDDVWLNLEFYRIEGGSYSDTPNATRRIALDGAPSPREPGWVPLDIVLRGATHERRKTQKSWPRAFNMLLRIGDVTGDGRSDLFIGKNTPNGMDIFVGVPGPDLFARRPQDVPIVVPNDEEYAWLVDLNRDGKQDILMHDPFTLRDAHGAPKLPPGTEPHRVTMIVAR